MEGEAQLSDHRVERIAHAIFTWSPACLLIAYALSFFLRFSFVPLDSLFLGLVAVPTLIFFALIRSRRAPLAPTLLFLFFLLTVLLPPLAHPDFLTSMIGYQYEETSLSFFLFLIPFFLIGMHASRVDWARASRVIFYGLTCSQILFWAYAFTFNAMPLPALFLAALQLLILAGLVDSQWKKGRAFLLIRGISSVPALLVLVLASHTTVLAVCTGALLFVLLFSALFQGRVVTHLPGTLSICIAVGLLWVLGSISLIPNLFPIEREGVIPWSLYASVAEETVIHDPTRLIWGEGANRFSLSYEQFKPTDINATDGWHITFSKAPSFLGELLFASGVIGVALFAVFLIACVRRGAGTVRNNRSIAGVLFFLGISAVFFHLPAPLYIAAAVILGILLAPMARDTSGRFVRFQKVIPLLLISLALAVSVHVFRTTASSVFYERGVEALTKEEYRESIEELSLALLYRRHAAVYERRAFAGQLLLDQLSENENPTPEEREEFFGIADRAVGDAELAFEMAPSYQSAMTAGNIHTILLLVGLRSSFGSADTFYSQAKSFAPHNPLPSFARGRLFALTGENSEAAVAELTHTLSIKKDFVPAQTLLDSIRNR